MCVTLVILKINKVLTEKATAERECEGVCVGVMASGLRTGVSGGSHVVRTFCCLLEDGQWLLPTTPQTESCWSPNSAKDRPGLGTDIVKRYRLS